MLQNCVRYVKLTELTGEVAMELIILLTVVMSVFSLVVAAICLVLFLGAR
jgi:hypothetical protein